MALNARSKGRRGEKKAIEWLRTWTGKDFARTPGSGGLRWGKAENIAGDIVCIEKNYLFPIAIEVKFYADINFEHLLYPGITSDIEKFWKQARDDAKRAEKIPMLFMRYNNMPNDMFFVMFGQRFATLIPANIKPFLHYSKGVVITNTYALKGHFKLFEQAAWDLIKIRYGKTSK